MAIGPRDCQSNRDAVGLCQQAALDAGLAAIRGVGAGFFPTQRRVGPRAVHAQPLPVYPLHFVLLRQPGLPELHETPASPQA